ncbi:hypothetical protein K440DRAFT_631156 [Wilcoxina mikolae CBS 423.85]|nr:hypothetical protein K440DRAFT_631156 [Wilcoxina mikolae CBS 423.85]
MPITIAIVAYFASLALSQGLNFWVRRPGVDQNCRVDGDGTVATNCSYAGGCLYNRPYGKMYCCRPGFPQCTGWNEECDTKASPTGFNRQIFCRRNSDTWCCNKEQERCASDESNRCEPKIENPLLHESNSTYTSVKNVTLAGPTGVDGRAQGTATNAKNGGDGPTQTPQPNTNGNVGADGGDGGSARGTPSAGVIAGATIGGLAGLVLIVMGIIWVSKGFAREKLATAFRRQQNPQSSSQERTLNGGVVRSGANTQEPPKLATEDDTWDGCRRVFRP